MNLDPSKFPKYTVIGYQLGCNCTPWHGVHATDCPTYKNHLKPSYRALNCATGKMGPVRDTYEEAEKDFGTEF